MEQHLSSLRALAHMAITLSFHKCSFLLKTWQCCAMKLLLRESKLFVQSVTFRGEIFYHIGNRLSEQFIWRTAIDMQRENNLEERGDSKTLKVRPDLPGAVSSRFCVGQVWLKYQRHRLSCLCSPWLLGQLDSIAQEAKTSIAVSGIIFRQQRNKFCQCK